MMYIQMCLVVYMILSRCGKIHVSPQIRRFCSCFTAAGNASNLNMSHCREAVRIQDSTLDISGNWK